MKRTYFLCPGFDYPPESISLGSIISSPSEPSVALNMDDDFRPPKGVIKLAQEGATIRREDLRQVKHGIISIFLRLTGFGSDADQVEGIEDTFKFSKIETVYYKPSEEYVQKAVQSEDVKFFLASSLFRKPLYLVTGLKIVRGASQRRPSKAFSVGTAVGNVAGGVPIGVGVGAEFARSRSESKSFEKPSDFIFAPLKAEEVDVGVDDVPDAVAEEVFYDSDDRTVVLYSAGDYRSAELY